MTVEWNAPALAELHAIEAALARKSPRAAARLVARAFELTDLLEQSPRYGAVVQEYGDPDLRELLLEGKYRVFYRVYPTGIEVASVSPAWKRAPRGI